MPQQKPPYLGFGLDLRAQHCGEIFTTNPNVDCFEVNSESYMVPGGQPLRMLDRIAERYPVVMHGRALSIASTAPLDMDYLADLKALASRINAKWISDHLCWTGVDGVNLHELLPVPYTEEALNHVAGRIARVQDYLGRRIVIENIASYIEYECSEMSEWEFIAELSRRADCWLLLDVNNVFVSSINHDFDTRRFLSAIPPNRVVQFHLAGHSAGGTCLIDSHDQPVCEDVWKLYGRALERFGPVSTIIERDGNIPPLAELVAELGRARQIAGQALLQQAGAA